MAVSNEPYSANDVVGEIPQSLIKKVPKRVKIIAGALVLSGAGYGLYVLGKGASEAPTAATTPTETNQEIEASGSGRGQELPIAVLPDVDKTTTTQEQGQVTPTTDALIDPVALESIIPIEQMPTSSNPEVLIPHLFDLLETAYNDTNYDLMDYIFYDGQYGNIASTETLSIAQTELQKNSDEDKYEITVRVLPEETHFTPQTGGFIRVEQLRQFKDYSTHTINDLTVQPKEIYVSVGGIAQKVTLYLISRTEPVCVFEESECR